MILSILLLIAITIFCLVNHFRNHRDITSTFASIFYRSCGILFPNHHIWKSLPPGPSGWPLLGNAYQLDGEKPHETLTEWARTYGDLYSIRYLLRDSTKCNFRQKVTISINWKSNAYFRSRNICDEYKLK